MNDENELLEPLATEAGQEAIVRAIRDISSLEYAVRAEQAASTASAKAGEASQSALEASNAEDKAKDWATKTDTYVEQETITIPPEQEGEEPTTETINLYSARYYAALAQDIYNNMSFDSVPTENSTNMVNSGVVYSALDLKADKSTTYTKTETDNLINTRLAELVASAPAALDTLQELATALGNDPNFATTIATQLGNKADKSDTYTKTEVDTALSAKADLSTTYTKTEVDTALSNVQSTLTFDNVPTANSDNPVKSSGIKTALDGKQDTLTFDSTPTANSTNPVTSGGVYTALQNVNIDIDDEITEDSDNPVTSAAIYEALLNFTPSGGDSGGAGNASGMAREELWSGSWSSGSITLSSPIAKYDLIEIIYHSTGGGRTQNCSRFISSQDLLKYTSESSHATVYGYGERFYDFYVQPPNILVRNSYEARDYIITEIYGIKFSKNLSEQMYSNVLYENSSGWSSGSITLNDTLDNYDFIQCDFRNEGDPSQYINSNIFDAKLLLDGRLLSFAGFSSRYFNATVTSSTVLTLLARGDYVLTKITGYKLAKGGYSGIVSDARMTVKSGFVDLSNGLSGNARYDYNIVFDSPMPDNNYVVMTEDVGFANNYNNTDVTICDKTNSGFTLTIYLNGNRPATSNTGVSWIAIRPNSYTREGMVEDVLFSNSSGVNSGTINLSGNISDYDLIEIYRFANDNKELYSSVISSSDLLQRNSDLLRYVAVGDGNNYTEIYCPTDSSIVIRSISGEKITKITGIKFGRYVSGVAVDTTVTQNSNAVITSGAVYDALLNIPSGGGGGSSVTVDTEITETSLNPVTSLAIYNALLNFTPSGGGGGAGNVSGMQQDVLFESSSGVTTGTINLSGNISDYDLIEVTTSNMSGWSDKKELKVFTVKDLVSGNAPYIAIAGVGGAYIIFTYTSETQLTIETAYYEQLWKIRGIKFGRYVSGVAVDTTVTHGSSNVVTSGAVYDALQNYTPSGGGSSITVDSAITENGTNPVTGGAIYTALGDKADKSTTYTKTEVDTALASKGDVTTDTSQNITGTKTFVGQKKVLFKQSTSNDKLGFTLYGNTGTERGYLEFNPTNTVDGVTGLMTLGNYATSAASLTQVGFRRYSNISGESGAYNLLMPMVADARTPFSLTTSYTNFYLPLGFKNGSTIVKTDKSGVVDISSLLASLEARIAALEGN